MTDSIPTIFERELSHDVVDPKAMFKMPAESDVVVGRKTVKLAPQDGGGGDISPDNNTAIRFKIRSGDFIDADSVYCTVKYKQSHTSNDGTDNALSPNGVNCLIREIRLRSGTGAQIETIREAGLLQSVLMKFSHSKTHNDTVHTIAGGGNTKANRMGHGAANTYEELAFHLPSSFLNTCGKFVDTNAMKGLIIEIELYSNAIALEGNGTVVNPTYNLSNPQIVYDEVMVSPAYKKSYLMHMARNGSINIPYSTYTHSKSASNSSVRISRSVSRLKDIITVARLNSNLVAGEDSLGTFGTLSDAGTWSYQIGSDNLPVGSCQTNAQTYREALKVFGRQKDAYCGSVTLAEFKVGSGIIAVDCELSPGTPFSGTKTSNQPDIILNNNSLFDANPTTLDSWLHHERIMKLGNGVVEILE